MVKKKEPDKKRRKEINDPALKQVMHRIGENAKNLRERLDWSQQELGVKAKVASSTISEIETKTAFNVKVHTLVSIAKALKVDLADLLK